MMLNELDSARHQIAELRESGKVLGEAMMATARRLRAEGLIPPSDFRNRISAYRSDFEAMHSLVMGDQTDTLDCATSIDHLEARVNEHQQMQQAVDVLNGVLLIRHQDDKEFVPLAECHDRIRKSIERLSSSGILPNDEELQSVVAGTHSGCALLRMIRESEDLADDAWTELNDEITAAWGRTLATAAARGRLEILSEAESDGGEQ